MSGHQFSTNSRIQTNDPCSAPIPLPTVPEPSETAYPLNEGVDDRLGSRKLHAALAPGRRARRDTALVEPACGVLDEAHAATTVQESADRRVVADIGRHPE